MVDVLHYLERRSLGLTKGDKYRNCQKVVLHLLEDEAAKPVHNQPCEFSGEPRATFLMDFSPNMLRVASTHGDHTVRVTDIRTGKCTHILTGHPRTPWCLAFNPTSNDILASGCLAGEVRIWDLLGGGSEVLNNPITGQVITSLAFHPSGQLLVFATANYIYFWDWTQTKPFSYTKTSYEYERIRWLRFDPFGNFLYTGIINNTTVHREGASNVVPIGRNNPDLPSDSLGLTDDRGEQSEANRARYQRLLQRFMAFQQDRSSRGHSSSDASSPNSPVHEESLERARQYAQYVTAMNGARRRVQEYAMNFEDPHRPTFLTRVGLGLSRSSVTTTSTPSLSQDDNSSSRLSSAPGRQDDSIPRRRWGRYGPSFFGRRSSSNNDSEDRNSNNSSSNLGSGPYRCHRSMPERFPPSSDRLLPIFRSGQDMNSTSRTNLFPSRGAESAESSAASSALASSSQLSHVPRSENAASESLDANEFQIVPVDQERDSGPSYSGNRTSAFYSASESGGHSASFRQQRDELHSLIRRYMNRSGEGSSASSGAAAMTARPPVASSSSAASTAEGPEINPRLSSMGLSSELARDRPSYALPSLGRHQGSHYSNPIRNDVFLGLQIAVPPALQSVRAVSTAGSSAYTSSATHQMTTSEESAPRARQLRRLLPELNDSNRASSFVYIDREQLARQRMRGPFSHRLPFEIEIRHSSSIQDRFNPRPVSDQTSQTLGAMNLPESLDQGTDVTGLEQHEDCEEPVYVDIEGVGDVSFGSEDHFNARSEAGSTFDFASTLSEDTDDIGNEGRYSAIPDLISADESLDPLEPQHRNIAPATYEESDNRAVDLSMGSTFMSSNRSDGIRNYPSSSHFELESNVNVGRISESSLSSLRERTSNRDTEVAQDNMETALDLSRPSLSVIAGGSRERTSVQEPVIETFQEREAADRFDSGENSSQFSQDRYHLGKRDLSSVTGSSSGMHSEGIAQGEKRRRLSALFTESLNVPAGSSLPASNIQDPWSPSTSTAQTSSHNVPFSFGMLPVSSSNITSSLSSLSPVRPVPFISAFHSTNPAPSAFRSIRDRNTSVSASTASRALTLSYNPATQSSEPSVPVPASSGPRVQTSGLPFNSSTLSRDSSDSQQTYNDTPHSSQRAQAKGSILRNSLICPVTSSILSSSSSSSSSAATIPSRNSASSGSILRGRLLSQSSSDATSRLRNLTDSGEPSAFSIFSTSNREPTRCPSEFRSSSSLLNPASANPTSSTASYPPHSGPQPQLSALETNPVLNSTAESRQLQSQTSSSEDNLHAVRDVQDRLQQAVRQLRDVQTSVRELTQTTPQLNLMRSDSITEYLAMRVSELDRRISDLEESYNSRLRELQRDCLMRRIQNNRERRRLMTTSPYFQRHSAWLRERMREGGRDRPQDSGDAPETLQAQAQPEPVQPDASGGEESRAPPTRNRRLLECLMRRGGSHQTTARTEVPSSVTIQRARDEDEQEGSSRDNTPRWNIRHGHLHPDYSSSILDDTINRPDEAMQHMMNRTIAGAFLTRDDPAVASNIVPQTHRIQQWDISEVIVPDIGDATANVVVKHCKLHNDASCDLSKDGTILATFVPSHRGFPDDNILGIFSLKKETFAQCLYTKSFGPNAISVSISPVNRYVMVGLAAKRLFFFSINQMVAQVYKFVREKAGENSMQHITDLFHSCTQDRQSHVSVNSARWLPGVGEGMVYGTNRGDLHFCRPGSRKVVGRDSPHTHSSPHGHGAMAGGRRRSTVRSSIATQTTTVSIRRSASTQTLADEAIDAGESSSSATGIS